MNLSRAIKLCNLKKEWKQTKNLMICWIVKKQNKKGSPCSFNSIKYCGGNRLLCNEENAPLFYLPCFTKIYYCYDVLSIPTWNNPTVTESRFSQCYFVQVNNRLQKCAEIHFSQFYKVTAAHELGFLNSFHCH